MTLLKAIKEFFGGIETKTKESKQPHPASSTAGSLFATKGGTPFCKDSHDTRYEPAESAMQLKLGDIEPFNIPPVNNDDAAAFMRHLTGREPFTFSRNTRPRSLLLYSLKFGYPRHSFADGLLLSWDVDTFHRECSAGSTDGTMKPIMDRYTIGRLHIEYGGNLSDTVVSASPFNPP